MTDQSDSANSAEKTPELTDNSGPDDTNLTADSQSVQEQEAKQADTETTQSSQTTENSSSQGADPEVDSNITAYLNRLHDLLCWKEGLKLWTLGENLNMAYYKEWASESNKLFIRSSVLRKRRKTIENAKKDQT
jgi:hypothetical protein